ncbi:MAG TPA: enoyl-CoA hydratase [Usitatibacter sp.]|jgi:enoyl-CoA hydratase/carnithine racemase|nr:enoyl-CoA hydratase [Usitatibacter sp.]
MNDASHPPSSAAPVERTDSGAVAVLRLNQPARYNALSRDVLERLHAELDAIAADMTVRVVVVTGTGKAFCAGHDLREMRSLPHGDVAALFASCTAMMQKITALPQPVIAAVNGIATAAGCQLVAQCDLAVASEEARFAVSGVNLGLFCSTPAVPLSRNIARKRAAEMLFTGDFIDAPTALAWGLVNRVAPAGNLMPAVQTLVQKLLSKPREALALGKALFYRQLEERMAPAYRDASGTIADNMAGRIAQEGVAAFLEKRSPEWER